MACWVIESIFLSSPDKGFWACLGDLPPGMPRQKRKKNVTTTITPSATQDIANKITSAVLQSLESSRRLDQCSAQNIHIKPSLKALDSDVDKNSWVWFRECRGGDEWEYILQFSPLDHQLCLSKLKEQNNIRTCQFADLLSAKEESALQFKDLKWGDTVRKF